VQRILSEFDIGDGARAEFIAHCTFPNAEHVVHQMEATVHVGRHSVMKYQETHYHGEVSGIEVRPQASVTVDEGGRFVSGFLLTTGRVGRLDFDYVVDVAAEGVAELTAKVYGYGNDDISVKETIRLNGAAERGLAKSRIALREHATAEVVGATEGNAPFARGHVDCVEIVRDHAVANAVPVVKVTAPYLCHARGGYRRRRQERDGDAGGPRSGRGGSGRRDRPGDDGRINPWAGRRYAGTGVDRPRLALRHCDQAVVRMGVTLRRARI